MAEYPTKRFLINLTYRKDRIKKFNDKTQHMKLFEGMEVAPAISGDQVGHPDSWVAGAGAWGCYRSHHRILEKCLNERLGSYIVFEDDAQFKSDFEERAIKFFEHLPEDWEMAYLGGQLIHAKQRPPIQVNPQVLRPFNVNRTHCFALSREGMKKVYRHISELPFHPKDHIDHHLGRLHEDNSFRVYCPPIWIVGQHGSSSNVSGKNQPVEFYQNPIIYAKSHWLYKKPVCILYKCAPNLLHECDFLHPGNTIDSRGFDITLTEASRYRHPLPKVTEWYNWIRAECAQEDHALPCAYHPFLSRELLEQAGATNVLVLEHCSSVKEIRLKCKEFVEELGVIE